MPRVATIGCGMLITIFFMICIIQNVFSAHLGQYSIERRSLELKRENTVSLEQPQPPASAAAAAMPPRLAASASSRQEGVVVTQQDRIRSSTTNLPALSSMPLDLTFASRLPQPSTPNVNLFEEYMSRGLYTCTSSYLDALGKLHALIAEVYADYQECQKLMKSTPKTFSRTDIDALDDMLDEWEKEDAETAVSSSAKNSVASGSQPQESQQSQQQQQQQQQQQARERISEENDDKVIPAELTSSDSASSAPEATYAP